MNMDDLCAKFSAYFIYVSGIKVYGIFIPTQLKCGGINTQGKIGLKQNFESIIKIAILLRLKLVCCVRLIKFR